MRKPNFKELEKIVSRMIYEKSKVRIKIIFNVKEYENEGPRGQSYFEINSQDIKESVGVFGSKMEYVKLSNFNGGYNSDSSTYYLPLVLKYKELDGGKNSIHFENLTLTL